jgi:hypothetical protein
MADNVIRKSITRKRKVTIVGVDLYSDFVEKSMVNYQKYRKSIKNLDRVTVDFQSNFHHFNRQYSV